MHLHVPFSYGLVEFTFRWEEALGLCSTVFVTPMNGLVQFLPEVSVVGTV